MLLKSLLNLFSSYISVYFLSNHKCILARTGGAASRLRKSFLQTRITAQ